MIEELRIRNFAIIDKLTVPLKKGFNVLTGETGAGKSIIIDAVGVLLKEKVAAHDFVRHETNEAVIEATLSEIDTENFDIPQDESVIVKKILNIHGKTRSYINDSAFSSQHFVKFISNFINIHGQHEHTYLLKKENHLEFFDTVAGLKEDALKFKDFFEKVETLKKEVEKLKAELVAKKERLELLQFQLDEIRRANLKELQEEELTEQKQILTNVLKLRELAELSFSLLYEDKTSAHYSLSKTLNILQEICKFDSRAQEIRDLVNSALAHTEEAVYILRKIKESYEPDPETLEAVEERLSLINKLKSKYGKTIRDILEYAVQAEKEISSISLSEEELKDKEKQLNRLMSELNDMAKTLSLKRRNIISAIEKEIIEELKFLGFSNPQFEIKISERELSCHGIDEIEFYFSANPGQPPRQLIKVASGGELSRLMLALKCVELKFAKKTLKSITLIFDEIDAGIGGRVAENVGRRLKELSKTHQVICVTHLPQIARFADHHLKIEKLVKDNTTVIKVETLSEKERKEEIARMLSGRITESSLFHAEELLSEK